MRHEEMQRIIHRLAKRHTAGFEVRARCLTDSGKMKCREGVFRELTSEPLVLDNAAKGGLVRLRLGRISDLRGKG